MNKAKAIDRGFRLSFLFIMVFILGGCSHVGFIAGGNTPFKITAEKGSDEFVEVEGTADFYFWGQAPDEFIVDLENIETQYGMMKPSFVSVEQTFGWRSLFYTFVTLGLYCPVDYKVKMLKVSQGPAGALRSGLKEQP